MYKLRDWVDPSKITFDTLSMNTHPAAIVLLEQKLESAWWPWISENPQAMQIIKANPSKVIYGALAKNPHPEAVEMIKEIFEESPNSVNFTNLSKNKSQRAIDFLMKNPDRACWINLMKNPTVTFRDLANANVTIEDLVYLAANPNMIDIVRQNMNEFLQISDNEQKKMFWFYLSQNPAAIDILEKNIEKVTWYSLSKMPEAIHLIKKKIDEVSQKNERKENLCEIRPVSIFGLSKNPAAIDILERIAVQYNIKDYSNLSSNPAIFEYDYVGMRESRARLHEELMAAFWSPERVLEMLESEEDYESVLQSD